MAGSTTEATAQSTAGTDQTTATARGSRGPPKPIDIDKTKPQDFDGQVSTTNGLPSAETLREVDDYVVLDRDGKTRTFESLYNGRNAARRVLVIFVRHFFCGNCQEYLRSLSESVTVESLLRLPVSTCIVVIGCGDPALIDMYVEATNCPFLIYTDPTRSLFDKFGMIKTLSLGPKPAYMKKSITKGIFDSIGQALRHVPDGLALKSGDQRQVGGEFLFEPLDIVTPITTPREEGHKRIASLDDPGGHDRLDEGPIEVKRVSWCHRMTTTRDHAEIPELMEILGLDSQEHPIKDKDRWTKALEVRKGTGTTMANQMSQVSSAQEEQSISS
ncbi:fmHP [Drechmeria coniospora]|uniref:FmHP n=1 Tax=Drechmeria coniospora TaxID=98403 RepID=A0A151GTR5_DRECN|nr:fmHP [Drechmeria coniospora]KYK60514.1 fmHP [Drechmeria coniospora]